MAEDTIVPKIPKKKSPTGKGIDARASMKLDTVGEAQVDEAYIERVATVAEALKPMPVSAPEDGDESVQLPPYVPNVDERFGMRRGALPVNQYRLAVRECFESNPKAWAGVVARFNPQQRQLMVLLAMQNSVTEAMTKTVPPMGKDDWKMMHPAYREAICHGVELMVRDCTRVALEIRKAALTEAMVVKVGGLHSKDERARQAVATEIIEWEFGRAGVRITSEGDGAFADLMTRVAIAAERSAGIHEDIVIDQAQETEG